MSMIKLSEWCDKSGVAYITAYRLFKSGKFPGYAYQTEKGTILVEDEAEVMEERVVKEQAYSDASSHFLKDTIDFIEAGSSIKEFASFILSNYKLEKQSNYLENMGPKKVKPSQEMTDSHFKKFLPKNQKPSPNMILMDQAALDQITSSNPEDPNIFEKLKNANITECPVNKKDFLTEAKKETDAGGSNINLQNGSVVDVASPEFASGDLSEPSFYKNSKIFVSSYNDKFIRSYEHSRDLVDLMVEAGLLPSNDMIIIDRQAKEICHWDQRTFDTMHRNIKNMKNGE